MTDDDLLKLMNEANERGEFHPADYPVSEDIAKWFINNFDIEPKGRIEGFREVLKKITTDEIIEDRSGQPGLIGRKFDEYFNLLPEKVHPVENANN